LAIAADIRCYLLVPDLLECLADLARAGESYREGGRLLGAADGARRRMGSVRFKALDPAHQKLVVMLRETLGDSDFDEALAEGVALSTEEAIAYAQRGRGERKRPASGWASLTPAELDVVRLMSDGLANKDIAARLFISPRTVETHLTHVYAKLGFTSRVQLAQQFSASAHRAIQ
jgi:DNA-binding CsgD family transcriptional regulator